MDDNRPPPPSSTIDLRSGFCSATKIFHSPRPPVTLPPENLHISTTSFAFSLLSSSSSPSLPTHIAFIDASTGASLSYPDFYSQVLSLASALRSPANDSLSKGQVAFVLSPACLEIPVLYFALLSIGAVVSPSNPASTPQEIAHLYNLTNPSIAFATSATAHLLPRHVIPLLLDSPRFRSLLVSRDGGPSAAVEISQSDPAAILYSSGTTGRVKGVLLTNRNLISQLAVFNSTKPRGQSSAPATVQMITVPLFHVYGFVFCTKAVAMGETAVLMTERFEVRRVLGAVESFRVTHLTMAPPVVVAMVREVGGDGVEYNLQPTGRQRYDLGSLVAVSCGGAPASEGLIRRFAACFPHVSFRQAYGLTESTAGIFRPGVPEECLVVGSSGRLVPNCQAKIVDPVTGTALAPGEQGELWLKGPNIMQGYIGDEESTAKVLDSEGWLKTGDLCYIDKDGFLFVVDRLKELIKYKGYQVAPAELEHLLQTHPHIMEAAVVPYPDEEAGQVPKAFVVRKPGVVAEEAEIMDFVSRQVAPYKKIRRVSFVNSIPRNAAGKILRKDLMMQPRTLVPKL